MASIFQAIETLSKEKGIDPQIVMDQVKEAMLVAARKQFKGNEELAAEYDLWPVTECDSEVLGLLIAGSRGSLMERCAKTASVAR